MFNRIPRGTPDHKIVRNDDPPDYYDDPENGRTNLTAGEHDQLKHVKTAGSVAWGHRSEMFSQCWNGCMSSKLNHAKTYSTQGRCFMIKTDPTMLVYNATEQPWTDDCGVIVSPHRERAICNLEPRDYKIENAMLICAAPPLLKVAQKLMLWMEECMAACDFNQDDMDLYHELRQTIRTAGGFSSETHWWQGPCICHACGHAWRGVVEIPVETTSPQIPLECGECHQMTGGPA